MSDVGVSLAFPRTPNRPGGLLCLFGRNRLPSPGAENCLVFNSVRYAIPTRFAKALYRGRARIEQAVGKLKRFKRIALRCEKTKRNFASFVALAAGFILVKSVHTA